MEGECRIEVSEKGAVGKVVVPLDAGAFERPAGQVSQIVVDASDGEGG